MLIHKGYRFRIYPNQKQATLIHKTIGCTRFVFNFLLAKQKQKDAYWYKVEDMVQQGQLSSNEWKGEFFNKKDRINDVSKMKQQYSFLKEVDSTALQKSVEHLNDSYTRYYTKQNQAPRFKSKKNPVQSYTTTFNKTSKGGTIRVVGTHHIQMPKLGLVRFAKSREVKGRILNATIRRNPSGKYFVSLVVEEEVHALPQGDRSVGIDVGLRHFAILSTGKVYENPKFFHSLEGKVAKAQRILSRRQQVALKQNKPLTEAKNYQKQKRKVARLHEKIKEARTDYLQKISTDIIKNHDVIGIEDLKVSNMIKNHKVAKAISEVSWFEFRTMLEYKADWYDKQVVAVNPRYTSQTCHACRHIAKENRRTQALFQCVSCGHTDNADVNAAKNIRDLALA